jgi:hypothetical protein
MALSKEDLKHLREMEAMLDRPKRRRFYTGGIRGIVRNGTKIFALRRSNPHGTGGAGGVDYGTGKLPVSRFLPLREGTGVAEESLGGHKVIRWRDGLLTDKRGRPIIRNADEGKRWEAATGFTREKD